MRRAPAGERERLWRRDAGRGAARRSGASPARPRPGDWREPRETRRTSGRVLAHLNAENLNLLPAAPNDALRSVSNEFFPEAAPRAPRLRVGPTRARRPRGTGPDLLAPRRAPRPPRRCHARRRRPLLSSSSAAVPLGMEKFYPGPFALPRAFFLFFSLSTRRSNLGDDRYSLTVGDHVAPVEGHHRMRSTSSQTVMNRGAEVCALIREQDDAAPFYYLQV